MFVTALVLAAAPQAVAAPSVVTFDAGARITGDTRRGTVTFKGTVLESSCVDLVSESPIDPAFVPCPTGTAFVLITDGRGAPAFGFHGEIDAATDTTVTLRVAEGRPLALLGHWDSPVRARSTDLFGIWGTDGIRLPDLMAIWGTDGAAIWGTGGVAVEAEGKGSLHAIWGTNGAAIWGTDGAVLDPDLLGIVATMGPLADVAVAPKALDDLPTLSLEDLIAKGIAVQLDAVSAAELSLRDIELDEICAEFACD